MDSGNKRNERIRFLFSIVVLITLLIGFASVSHFEDYEERINVDGETVSFKMIAIPSGEFRMGSPEAQKERSVHEGPVHLTRIDSLWVGQFEVTWDLFALFLKKNKISFEESMQREVDGISRPTPPFEDPSLGMGKAGFPVVNISPYAALTFCKWLSTITGNFYRLPTEAEWEYACRAGSDDSYHFGDDLSRMKDYAVYFENSNGKYAKVGSKKPNEWGLYDMHGNVGEWTLDLYEEEYYSRYIDIEADNPWNVPYVLHPRVYRGGSWDDDPEDLRSAARMKSGINLQRGDPQMPKSFWWYTNSEFIGFRIVRPHKKMTKTESKKFWAKVLDE